MSRSQIEKNNESQKAFRDLNVLPDEIWEKIFLKFTPPPSSTEPKNTSVRTGSIVGLSKYHARTESELGLTEIEISSGSSVSIKRSGERNNFIITKIRKVIRISFKQCYYLSV